MITKNILIVDDDPNIVRLLSGLLTSRQYCVDVAMTGDEALAKARHRPDLILLDRTLPDTEGLEVCRRIREDKRLRCIPVIILTGRDAIGEKVEGLYVGADDYITKPYDNEELIARVEAVLRRSWFSEYIQEEKENLLDEIKKIIQNGDIKTFFQPIISLDTFQPLGFEVLSRPPKNGLINNADFLFRVALTYGMYFELEMLCWEKAFRQWRESSGRGRLFMNCLPYLVENERFHDNIFKERGIPADGIVLEMTERMAIRDYVLFHDRVSGLKKAGLKIAIDDVGNGYASLDAIAETQPDYVKIDMFLIRDIHAHPVKQSIVESIVALSAKNGIVTVAEGIETVEELKKIRELKVSAVQGYFLAAPAQEIPESFSFDPGLLAG